MKILSVDDSAAVRQFIKNAVEVLGYEFCEAEDGAQALALLDNEHKDIGLILLDWNMPVMDGMQMLVNLRKQEKYNDIPVLMVTTEVERDKVIQAIAAGAKNYLMKPFSQEELEKKILECLGQGF